MAWRIPQVDLWLCQRLKVGAEASKRCQHYARKTGIRFQSLNLTASAYGQSSITIWKTPNLRKLSFHRIVMNVRILQNISGNLIQTLPKFCPSCLHRYQLQNRCRKWWPLHPINQGGRLCAMCFHHWFQMDLQSCCIPTIPTIQGKNITWPKKEMPCWRCYKRNRINTPMHHKRLKYFSTLCDQEIVALLLANDAEAVTIAFYPASFLWRDKTCGRWTTLMTVSVGLWLKALSFLLCAGSHGNARIL